MTTTRPPKKPEEFSLWIQYQLRLKKSSFARIARRIGITRQAVRKCVLSPPPRIADEISADLGISRKRLWPHRYAA
jgi:lambda repressor-like predicted transcriptional regulator